MARNSYDIPKTAITAAGLRKKIGLLQLVSKKDRFLFFLGTLFLGFTAVTLILFPKLLGQLVDTSMGINAQAKTGATVETVRKVAIGFVYLFAAQALFSFLRIMLYVKVTENLIFELRNKLYKAIIKKPMEFFHTRHTGDLLSSFSADIGQIQDAYTTNIAMFLRQLLTIVGGGIYIFIVSPKLALYMLATVPVVVIISLFFGKYIRKVSRAVQDITGQNNVVVEETLTGIQSVKAYSNEQFEINRYQESAEHLRMESVYRGFLRGAFSSFIIICLFGSIVFLIFLGLGFVQRGEMKLGELIQFMLLTGFVGGGIGGMAEVFIQIQKTIGAVDRVMEIINEPGENLEETSQIYEWNQQIEFKQVQFAYPSRPENKVLDQIDFTLKKGNTIALVGNSGSGKSSIVNLLYRFYNAQHGNILVDGTNVQTIPLAQWRRGLALVPQDVMLFGGSIYDNIAYGNTQASYEQVMEAAKQANVHEFVSNFAQGYDTQVGERGVKLSGGQKQRVAIARAILANPQLLILDEATSALDSKNEQLVQQAIDLVIKNQTAIVIAHRLSTIKNADLILVLDKGIIVESGSHAQLYALNGQYTQLVDLQNLKEKSGEMV